jgi:SdpI/YfhL protein family
MPEQPFAIPAVALFVLAVPLTLGLIPRNRYYGVRTPRTLSDDEAWYRSNRVAGAAVMVASVTYGAVAMARPYSRTASDSFTTWALHLAAFAVPLAIGLIVAVRSGRHAP